jgi:hypothetical protein
MGESAGKPKVKVEGKKPHWNQQRKRSSEQPKKGFKAPTPGLEHVYFTVGDAKDAANYDDVKRALANYAGINFKYCGTQTRQAIEKVAEPSFNKPAYPTYSGSTPPTPADEELKMKWEIDINAFFKRQSLWDEEYKSKAFQLVLGHCHPDVRERLESSSEWETIDADQDLIKLLELIRNVVHKHDEVKQGTMALVEQTLQFYLNFQGKNESLPDFYKAFKARADIIDTYKGQCGYHPELYRLHAKALAAKLGVATAVLTDEQKKKARETACEEFKAAVFVRLANESYYGEAKRELDNAYLMGNGSHPTTMEEAYRFLQNYKPTIKYRGQRVQIDDDGVALAQPSQKLGPCHACKGAHLYRDCPELNAEEKKAITQAIKAGEYQGGKIKVGQSHMSVAEEELEKCMDGVANVNINEEEASIGSINTYHGTADEDDDVFDGVAHCMPTSRKSGRRKYDCGRSLLWLDTAATEHSMFASEFLEDLFISDVTLRQHCNAGYKLVRQKGRCLGFEFWNSEGGIANLLSGPQLEADGNKIKYKTGGKLEVWTEDGRIITFERSTGVCKGMHYIDLSRPQDFIRQVTPKDAFAFIETVRGNYEGFTAEQIQKAQEARDGAAMMAHPSQDKLRRLVSTRVIENVPFNQKDLNNSNVLFGPDRGAIRGKTVRRRPSKVRPELVAIPRQLYERLKDVTIAADVMFLNGLPFFVTQ